MRMFLSFLFMVGLLSTAFSQKSDIDVYEKKEGEKVFVYARNTGEAAYHVKITITAEGMDVLPSMIVEAELPGGFMKEMATITPRPGEPWSYGYDVAITQTVTKPTPEKPGFTSTAATTTKTQPGIVTPAAAKTATSTLSDAAIVLYAKPGCGRCDLVRKNMNTLGIKYLEVNTESKSPEVNNMWSQMRAQGFPGGSITMPVVRVNGKYHYDIKDLQGFVDKLKS